MNTLSAILPLFAAIFVILWVRALRQPGPMMSAMKSRGATIGILLVALAQPIRLIVQVSEGSDAVFDHLAKLMQAQPGRHRYATAIAIISATILSAALIVQVAARVTPNTQPSKGRVAILLVSAACLGLALATMHRT